jgi:hypothetical protein
MPKKDYFCKIIRQKMAYYETGKKRGHYLQKVYAYLRTIRPTCVESERAFSATGFFATKIRPKLEMGPLIRYAF